MFKHLDVWKIHDQIHICEKPFSCRFCKKTFRTSSLKNRHELLHTGEKPHSCQICGKKFRVQSNMKVHETKFETHPNWKHAKRLPKTYEIDPESYNIHNRGKEQDNSFSSKQKPLKVSPIKIKIKQEPKNLESEKWTY